jgi:hypothetical protein
MTSKGFLAWGRAEIIPRFGRVHPAPIVAQEYMADSAGHFGPAEEAVHGVLGPFCGLQARVGWHLVGGPGI